VGCQKNFNKKFSAGDMPPTPVTKKIKLKAQVQILIKMDEARWPNLAVPNFYFIFKKNFN
jgi:hypothetical protein